MIVRETIYAALFTKVNTSANYNTKSRALRHWTEVPVPNMPAIFMTQIAETADAQTGRPTKWVMDVELYIYVATRGDITITPASVINPLLDSIEAALTPTIPDMRQTLGGLVHNCYIDGKIETDEGALGELGLAIVPVKIIAYN